MALLLIFAFASGFVTALTPCVLPILPVVLATTTTGGKRRPLGVIIGLIFSFTFFTLFLSAIVDRFGLPPDLLRNISIGLILFFGLTMIVPFFTRISERIFSRLTSRFGSSSSGKNGFWGGVVIGLTLGLLWAPCAGPILAAVITLAATRSVTFETVLITFAYICGSAIVLLLIAYGGQGIIGQFKLLRKYSNRVQYVFGIIMIVTALSMFLNIDRQFQSFLVQRLPSWALTPLGSLESSGAVVGELQKLRGGEDTSSQNVRTFDSATLLTNEGQAPEFVKPTQWLNTDQQLTMQLLKGKVVLIDFWTYSCINCIRTLPYLQSWYEKYKDKGFVIIGVHSPEFAFEKVQSNVEKAIKDFGLTYPVVMDNDFGTWEAYKNHYWPAHYLVDAEGVIRRHHFGEGDYENMERAIQALLTERGLQVEMTLTKEEPRLKADLDISPETYLGYKRMNPRQFVSPESVGYDQFRTYSLASSLNAAQFDFFGEWKISGEYAQAKKGAKLRYHFIGKEVNLVMADGDSPQRADGISNKTATGSGICTDEYCMQGSGQRAGDPSVVGKRVKITIRDTSGRNISPDVKEGMVYVVDDKLYTLAKFVEGSEGTVEIEFLDDAVQVHAFTFG